MAYSQTPLIEKADSLFFQKKYLESEGLYIQEIERGVAVKPEIWLRAAFLSEGSGQFAQALYYLSQYQVLVPSFEVLQKMEVIASKRRLKGYEVKDHGFLGVVYRQHYVYLVIAICAICLFAVGYWFSKQDRYRRFSYTRLGGRFFLLLFSWVMLNLQPLQKELIIKNGMVHLHKAPSSASPVVAVVGEGHRLPLAKEEGIWLKTRWEGQEVFLHRKNAWLISL